MEVIFTPINNSANQVVFGSRKTANVITKYSYNVFLMSGTSLRLDIN
jgi:hypothetical protein